jgi:hypothetical protein
MKLLSLSTDTKTVKGEKIGVLTGILYLAPANVSGYEVCPRRSKGCTDACLYTAGRGVFKSVKNARIKKTKLFFENRDVFLHLLYKDIKALIKKADKNNMTPAVRLNGTSDIEWTRFNIMKDFPDVQFYDYTKVLNRLSKSIPNNYHLTFSKNEANDEDCDHALKLGFNVAAVFNTKKGEALPKLYKEHPIYNGDETDVRFKDPKGGYIIGLIAKGSAKKDETGFVIKI